MASGGGTELTKEKKNYARAMFLVADLGTEAVKEVFDKIPIFEPKVLSKNIELKRKTPEMKAIPAFLRKILFPYVNESQVLKSSQFDLTMMVALVEKLYIPPPAEVPIWDATKNIINVIKQNRNKLAHSNASVNDQSFNDIWRDASNAILSLVDDDALKSRYQQKMQHLLQMTIDDGLFDKALLQDTVTGLQETQKIHSLQICELQKEAKRRKEDKAAFIVTNEIPADYGIRLQQELKTCYRENMAHISCNPLNPAATQPINKLYVKLSCVVQEDLNYPAGQNKKMKVLQHYCEIFEDQSEKKENKDILRILVQGCPGVGKTTFSKRVAIDWAEGSEKMLSERFENIFVLTLREVQQNQSLVSVIAEQLLPHKSPLVQHLETYIKNNNRCMFLFDGLDEMKPKTSQDIDKMIDSKYLRNACVVITSRPSESQFLITSSKIDQLARIVGFNEEDVKLFIGKFFGGKVILDKKVERSDEDKTSTTLFEETRRKGLSDIAKIPLILIILCLLYRHDKSLPDTMSKIYQRLQQHICRRQKDETESEVDPEDILLKLGKMAFDGLMKENDQLLFSKKNILEEVGEDAFKVGLIWVEKAKYESKYDAFFLHKTFQENTAAFYLGKETDNNNDEPWEKLKNKMKTTKDIRGLDLLLQFCSGASQRLAEQVLDFLDEKVVEIDPNLKVVLQSMEKLSQNKDLTTEELEMVNDYDYAIEVQQILETEIQQILETEAECLSNAENPTEIGTHIVHQVISKTGNVKKARERNILKQKKCIARISNDAELEHFVEYTTSVSWIKLGSEWYGTPYSLTEKTESLLQKFCDKNEHQFSVCIGNYCEADCTAMSKVTQLLKENTKIKYKLITFGTDYSQSNKYGREGWEKIFQLLSGIRYLIVLNLSHCEIPVTILASIGQIINDNADTLLQLDLGANRKIQKHFGELSKKIENPLSLTVLKLSWSLDPSDTDTVSGLLKKCQHIKVLHVEKCECEISKDIWERKTIKEFDGQFTVNKDTGKGLDVGQVLKNLDKVEMLEVIKAGHCQIDDAQIQNIPFNHFIKPSKIRKIHLSGNRIGSKGLQYLCEHHTMLQELEEIWLQNNKIGDEGGQVLTEYLQHFKKLKEIWVRQNGMSFSMKIQLKQTGRKYSIRCVTD